MVPHLAERFRAEFGYSPARSEVLSWERSVCKVLLTRGLRGCVIYSVDPETQQMLAGLGIPRLPDSARQ